uniref:Uncharacterized protein n=1 Tax=Anabas testudineus TaxID=64144 RepID=A0A3Q1K2S6_ANATE
MLVFRCNKTDISESFRSQIISVKISLITSAFADSIRHSSTRRVDHGHETNEAKVLCGEVHFFSIKSKALWELVIRQAEMAKTCARGGKCLSVI